MFIHKLFSFLYDAFRPLLGGQECCIYPVSCGDYAKALMEHKPIYVAIPKIILRVLSCNPITALCFRIKIRLSR